MKRIRLDFETRSELDIWKCGAWEYSHAPSTKILCTAWAEDNNPVIGVSTIAGLERLKDYVTQEDCLFVAHNAFFEQCIWKNILVKRYGFPPIPLKRWRCTLAKACAYAIPRGLEKAVQALNLPVHKDMGGRQIMLRLSKPLPTKTGEIKFDNDPIKHRQLLEYCMQDVETERALDNAIPDLIYQEQEIWFYDQLINFRGVRVDIDLVKKFIEILNEKALELNVQLAHITNGEITRGTQTVAILKYLNKEGAGLDSINKQSVSEAIKSGRLNAKHIQILRLRQQLGKSSLAKYKRLIDATDENGILRDCFVYHGASTGRFAGKLVQLQNLPSGNLSQDIDKTIHNLTTLPGPMREMLYPNKVMDTLSSCIRGVFIPKDNHELYITDYSAIEARVLMWLADETLGLTEFRNTDTGQDEDIYVKMAQRIYHDPTLTKKSNKKERTLGKQAILGASYGMGPDKFKIVCHNFGIEISEEQAHKVIYLYRATYTKIVDFWKDIEQTFRQAYHFPNHILNCGRIDCIYDNSRDVIFCKLPSNRILSYHSPKIQLNRFGNQGLTFMTEVSSQWVRRDTYGGLLTENCTQAVARDIMTYSFPKLEQSGFEILMHTHDEVVSQRPLKENRLLEMINIMCDLPDWAQGCPITAEGFTSNRYKKG